MTRRVLLVSALLTIIALRGAAFLSPAAIRVPDHSIARPGISPKALFQRGAHGRSGLAGLNSLPYRVDRWITNRLLRDTETRPYMYGPISGSGLEGGSTFATTFEAGRSGDGLTVR